MKRTPKQTTIYFEPHIHRALCLKTVDTDRSLSELVNEAVRRSLEENADDLAAFDDRANEPSLAFGNRVPGVYASLRSPATVRHFVGV